VVNVRPEGNHPCLALVMAGLARVAAILQRIAADAGELARARRVADLGAGGCPYRHPKGVARVLRCPAA